MRRYLPLALLCLVLTLPALAAGEWRNARLVVVPGLQAGPIRLGQPLSGEVFRVLGRPSVQQAPEPGPDGLDTGNVTWGGEAATELWHGINAKLNDGQGDQNVCSIYLVGVRAVTDRGAYIGCDLARARRLYPQARLQRGTAMEDDAVTLEVPGLTMIFRDNRLAEMVVLPIR